MKIGHKLMGRILVDEIDVNLERWLIEEGLELLAAYRSIDDPIKRRQLRELILGAAALSNNLKSEKDQRNRLL